MENFLQSKRGKVLFASLVMSVSFLECILIGGTKHSNTNQVPNYTAPLYVPPQSAQSRTGATNDFRVTSLRLMNGNLSLSCAWKEGQFFLPFLDVVCSTNLNSQWSYLGSIPVNSTCTNIILSLATNQTGFTQSGFIAVSPAQDQDGDGLTDWNEKFCLHSQTLLSDSDRDGYPDSVEALYNSSQIVVSNAWGFYPAEQIRTTSEFKRALSSAQDGAIVELAPGIYDIESMIFLPTNRILVTTREGRFDGRVILRSHAPGGIFITDPNDSKPVIFQGFALDLCATNSYQVGFWMGGNLPWSGCGATAQFKNLYIRLSEQTTQYDGWLYYKTCEQPSLIEDCVINCLGASNPCVIKGVDAPLVKFNRSTFICDTNQISTLFRSSPVETNACQFFSSMAQAFKGCSHEMDTDSDGLSDADELTRGMDPYLSDTDGDGVVDVEEVRLGTNPTNLFSHPMDLLTSFSNSIQEPTLTNYYGFSTTSNGWDIETPQFFVKEHQALHHLILTNELYLKVFSDLNRTGFYEEAHDVLQVLKIQSVQRASTITLSLGDVDKDGVNDLIERKEGTDPYDSNQYDVFGKIAFINCDNVSTVTNYWRIGIIEDGECLKDEARLSSREKELTLTRTHVTNGFLTVSLVRDLNRNGVYDNGIDVYYEKNWNSAIRNGGAFEFCCYDYDRDGVYDSEEFQEGTDYFNPSNYCCRLSLRAGEIYSTTNYVTAKLELGQGLIWGPEVVSNRLLSIHLAHLVVTNGARLSFTLWDDVNHNLVRETEEEASSYFLRPSSHESNLSVTTFLKNFDRNRNDLPDWWEQETHLNERTPQKNEDSDGDGLLDVHEYWAGTNPLVPDGSNTLLSALSRGVDDLLKGKDPQNSLELFLNYTETVSNFIFGITTALELNPNPQCWAKDLDWSGISVCNNNKICFAQRAGALISPTNMLFALHWPPNINEVFYFRGTNGVIYSTCVRSFQSKCYSKYNSRRTAFYPDLCLVDVWPPLPEQFVHSYRLTHSNMVDRIFRGATLPVIEINKRKEIFTRSLSNLDYLTFSSESAFITMGSSVPYWRKPFLKDIMDGDSSSPTFFVVDGELILLGNHTTTIHDGPIWRFTKWIEEFCSPQYYPFENFPKLPQRIILP